MATPHDALFKSVFGNPRHAAVHIARFLPNAVVQSLDLDLLSLRSGSFVDQNLRQRHTDLLFEAPFHHSESRAFLYLLFEHQSSSDPLMPLRLLRYMLRIWDQLLSNEPTRRTLPPIIPMVLHHGPEGWQAPVAFTELFEGPADVLHALGSYLPQFQLLLTDLSEMSDETLRVGALVEVVYRLFKHIWDHDLPAKLVSWRELLRSVAAEETTGLRALQLVIEYLVQARDDAVDALVEAMQDVHPAMQQIIETTADRLRREGHREGRLEGQAELVVRALETRNVAVPDDARARILACRDRDSIARWFDRALVVASVTDLFDEGDQA
ncbi:MAG: Rpn family recombination-promoting nuclease/putative transposase [Proteobacteria bacterium]|nr:Rpn family recombination-promoting nuclease/putative transposase [Pseudomonadota bacterium]